MDGTWLEMRKILRRDSLDAGLLDGFLERILDVDSLFFFQGRRGRRGGGEGEGMLGAVAF